MRPEPTSKGMATVSPGPGDALVVVDVQRDFLAGGALPVPGGDAVLTALNRHLERWHAAGLPVFATRDWHPPDHCSFRAHGGRWPAHCIAGTEGAEFPAALHLPPDAIVVSKATRREREALSGFAGTELDAALRRARARRLFVAGLATDVCVLATVRDARAHGWPVVVLRDAVRALDDAAGRRAEAEMVRLGAVLADEAPAGDVR